EGEIVFSAPRADPDRVRTDAEAERSRVSVADLVLETLETEGIEAAREHHRALRAAAPDSVRLGESLLNSLGYRLLREDRVLEAIAVLEMNVEAFPDEPNPYDSLGDALHAAGRLEEAKESYRKAVDLAEERAHPSLRTYRRNLERVTESLEEDRSEPRSAVPAPSDGDAIEVAPPTGDAVQFAPTEEKVDRATTPEDLVAVDAPVVALTGVRVVDGTGAPPREDQVLVVEGRRIRALGSRGDVEIPEGAQVLDLPGRTVLPGLVLLHEHLFYDARTARAGDLGLTHPQHFSFPRLYLAFGVTTIRTAGTDHPYADLSLKRRIDAGKMPGPEIHLTSPFLSGKGDPFLAAVILEDAEAARRTVRYWAAEGFTSFKAYQWIPASALEAVIDEAHRLGLVVTAHLGEPGEVDCRQAAEMGIDNLEHGFYPCVGADGLEPGLDGPRTRALLRTLVDRDVVLTQTFDRRWEPLSDRATALLDPSVRERYEKALAARPEPTPGVADDDLADSPHARLLRAFRDAGGRLVLGSDAGCCGGGNQVAGLASHHPLEVLVGTGFSTLDTIRIATLEGATVLDIDDRTGSIEVGKEADLLIVEGNPAARIEDLGRVDLVFADGVGYEPETLLESLAGEVGWH
ncbi:MAG: amidohydrolase family protein, partial [Gemmatimonadota bacterium]|nr:amidohydrolase family protein [Gemmatimonadota bacterium]